jgi:4-cresol dehydrogenase (hydroxylating)
MPELWSPAMGITADAETARDTEELRTLVDQAIDGNAGPLDASAARKQVPVWSLRIKFYGPARTVPLQWEFARERFARIAGARFEEGQLVRLPLTAEQKEQVPKAEFGIPALSIWSRISRSEQSPGQHYGHQGFSPIIPRSGEAIFEANRVFAEARRVHGIAVPLYSIPYFFWHRALMFIFLWPTSRDPAENAKARSALMQLVRLAAKAGFGEYRAAPAYQDLIMSTYSFNNHALLRFHETLKDAVDPNGIMSPGRYGIWPRHLRQKSG